MDLPKELEFDYLYKPRISIFGAVRKIREQRWNMVKKQVQYNFIYDYFERWAYKSSFDRFLDKDDMQDEEFDELT